MKNIYTQLARVAIAKAVGLGYDFDVEAFVSKYPNLKEKGASFVTINIGKDKLLRGCIGSLESYRALYEDIILNAKAAALYDPRFSSLTKEEYDNISIEVSILSKPEKLYYIDIDDLKSKIRIFKDGIVLKLGEKQSTFLPQVWEQIPDFDLFFANLCQKAGLNSDCLKKHPEVFIYQVEKYSE